MSIKPPIVISSRDLDRIEALLERMTPAQAQGHAALREELERAEVRAPQDMPPDVVTMNSRVTAQDESQGERHGERLELTLVYPAAAGGAGHVSVLAPVGSALLGLAKGQHIDWPMPDGKRRRLRVVDIAYQPEAAGDYHR
ncbi:nucleoside diphosphate kinase regulator [Dyella sp. 2RAB6]|uniref:nucleoside diphosphate kinase regulator n=1 Tax=Dyella sp. 2RAB6 TaxID=3232992 RepID=UPI003F90985D